MIKLIPTFLVFLRLLIAFAIFAIEPSSNPSTTIVILTLIYLGILSDVFDGIIARKHHLVTTNLRVYDTVVDLFYYMSAFYYVYRQDESLLQNNLIPIVLITVLESLMYVVSLIRFSKLPSPHAILSKIWGIYLVVELSLLILQIPGYHFFVALCFGVAVHIDRLLIYSLIKKWEHDIPSSFHALRLREGKEIKRNSLFN